MRLMRNPSLAAGNDLRTTEAGMISAFRSHHWRERSAATYQRIGILKIEAQRRHLPAGIAVRVDVVETAQRCQIHPRAAIGQASG